MVWCVTTGGTSVISKCMGCICCPSPSDDSGRRCCSAGCVDGGSCGVRAVRGSCVCGGCSVGVCADGAVAGGVFCTRCFGGFGCCAKQKPAMRKRKKIKLRRMYVLAKNAGFQNSAL